MCIQNEKREMIMKYVLREKETNEIVFTADRFSELMNIRVEENLIDKTYIDIIEE